MIEIYEVPRDIEPEEILWDGMQTLLLGAIVNPMGPTFFGVAAMGEAASKNLLHFSMNPFAQTVQIVGKVSHGSMERNDYARLHPIFQGFGCPTLFCTSSSLGESERAEVLEAWFRSFDGAANTAEMAMAYLGDPWKRVSKEMEGVFESLKPTKSGVLDFLRKKPHSGTDAIGSFMQASGTVRHLKPELKAFLYAWNGAIEHTSPVLARDAMKLELAIELFLIFSSSCALPAEIWEE